MYRPFEQLVDSVTTDTKEFVAAERHEQRVRSGNVLDADEAQDLKKIILREQQRGHERDIRIVQEGPDQFRFQVDGQRQRGDALRFSAEAMAILEEYMDRRAPSSAVQTAPVHPIAPPQAVIGQAVGGLPYLQLDDERTQPVATKMGGLTITPEMIAAARHDEARAGGATAAAPLSTEDAQAIATSTAPTPTAAKADASTLPYLNVQPDTHVVSNGKSTYAPGDAAPAPALGAAQQKQVDLGKAITAAADGSAQAKAIETFLGQKNGDGVLDDKEKVAAMNRLQLQFTPEQQAQFAQLTSALTGAGVSAPQPVAKDAPPPAPAPVMDARATQVGADRGFSV